MNSRGIVLNFVQLNANFVKYLTIKFISRLPLKFEVHQWTEQGQGWLHSLEILLILCILGKPLSLYPLQIRNFNLQK